MNVVKENILKCELYHDNYQNYRRYNIPKAQLIIADIPYNIGTNAYASNPMWYNGGDNSNGESKLAKKSFFNTDGRFKIAEYMHFCSRMLVKEPKERGKAPAMIVFCAYEQMQTVSEYGKRYRDKLPKFNNDGSMIYNWFAWENDNTKLYPKIHPTQKPVKLLKKLIRIFTDIGDVVIDPCAGSGSTLRAAYELGRSAYGFEVDKGIYTLAKGKMLQAMAREEQTADFEQLTI